MLRLDAIVVASFHTAWQLFRNLANSLDFLNISYSCIKCCLPGLNNIHEDVYSAYNFEPHS